MNRLLPPVRRGQARGLPLARDARTVATLVLLLALPLNVAWLNPKRDKIDAGIQQFKQGKYEDAIGKFGELLVDDPDSPLLNYNMGAANYKAGKYSEAIASFGRVKASEEDPKRAAKIAYNAGNAQYQLGAAAEAEKPQDALNAYAAALVAYRRALGIDPSDQDAKFNYEFVTKKIADLKKKLEEQQQQQQDQQQDQQQEQQPQDQEQQEKQEQQQPEQDGQEDQQQEQQQEPQDGEQQAQEDQQDEQQQEPQSGNEEEEQKEQDSEPQQAAGGEGQPSGEKKDKMSPEEAASLIDAAKNEEINPEDFARKLKGGGVADAAEDW